MEILIYDSFCIKKDQKQNNLRDPLGGLVVCTDVHRLGKISAKFKQNGQCVHIGSWYLPQDHINYLVFGLF